MKSTSIYIVLFISLFLSYYCSADTIGPFDALGSYCNSSGATTGSNNPIAANIDAFLQDATNNIGYSGFVTGTYGSGESVIYGLAQCRGDVSGEDCTNCIAHAAKQLPNTCINQTDARIWYDNCFLRYDTNYFLGILDTSFYILYVSVNSASDVDSFDAKLAALFDKIDSEAIQPRSEGFATGESNLSYFTTLYALVQCTRDLSPDNCAQCLSFAVQNFGPGGYCYGSEGCRVASSSCYVRYEEYPFFLPAELMKAPAAHYRKKIIYP